jgi:hypothetical protein
VEEILPLQQEFNSHFQDIHNYEATFNLYSVLSDINVEIDPAKFQMQMIDLQHVTGLRNTFQHVWYLDYIYLLVHFQCLVRSLFRALFLCVCVCVCVNSFKNWK